MNNLIITTQKQGIKKHKLFTAFFSVIIVFGLSACNKANPYKPGDKVFLSNKLSSLKASAFNVNLCQLIEPVSGHGETYIIYSPWAISVDTLQKYQTANIGSFQYAILKKKRKEQPSPMNFYAIIPNKKALTKTDLFLDIPAGYKYASDQFYIFPSLTSPEETIVKK